MNCRGVSRRLSAYIDNDLSPGIRQSVEEHLRSCRQCARRLAELEAIIASARNLPPLEVSAGFKERIMNAIRWNPKPVLGMRGIRLRFALAGTAFATAAVLVFLLSGPRPSTETTPPVFDQAQTGADFSEQVDSAAGPDFTVDPRVKIQSFPVPEGAESLILSEEDSLLLADSMSRIDEYVLPVINKGREKKVNVKF
jgi:hypothetical protein